ncbi:MAG: right-handed parallel beta-helix repeat-containing protein, partial [Phycisphaerae bacterium]|nr:right-handed parallel beta-helix repeat-containing protein [Phycisphaerae bacterium]
MHRQSIRFTRNTAILLLVLLIGVSSSCFAATYYVSPTGTAGGDGSPGDPWSLSKANTDLVAGDTAILMDGSYPTNIAPSHNGAPGNPITYQAANSRQAIIAVGTYRINVALRSYITVDGVKAENASRWVYGTGSHHITINDCYFRNSSGWESARFQNTGGYIRITNCHIESGTDSLHIREGEGHYIAGNTFIQASHTCLVIMGIKRSVIENNTLTNIGQKCMEVFATRGIYPPNEHKCEYNLIQNNWFGPTTSSGIQYAGNYSILRRNIFDDCYVGMNWANYGGSDPTDDPEAWWDEHNRFYNNVLYDCGRAIS